MFAGTTANELRSKFDRRARVSGQALRNGIQVRLAAHFQGEMMQANVAPTVEAYDGSGMIDLPEC
jgi:hypothetical protein